MVLFLRQQTSENLLNAEKRNEDLIFNHHFKSHRAALAFKKKEEDEEEKGNKLRRSKSAARESFWMKQIGEESEQKCLAG